ncbi:hypothetical protein PENTCL1PPCAC_22379, partial [Pristionchus entomophagus]
GMFYHLRLEHEIQLNRKWFGLELKGLVKAKLLAEVEGKTIGRHGVVIAVTQMESFGQRSTKSDGGMVGYKVTFAALVFRPFKGAVVDAVVTQVTDKGVMCEVGPVPLFIARISIPPRMHFDYSLNANCYKSADESFIIKKDAEIRVKIVGTRVDSNDIFCIGSLMDDFLGVSSE